MALKSFKPQTLQTLQIETRCRSRFIRALQTLQTRNAEHRTRIVIYQVTASFRILFLRITKPSLKSIAKVILVAEASCSHNADRGTLPQPFKLSNYQTLQTLQTLQTRNAFYICPSSYICYPIVVPYLSHRYPTYIPYHIRGGICMG